MEEVRARVQGLLPEGHVAVVLPHGWSLAEAEAAVRAAEGLLDDIAKCLPSKETMAKLIVDVMAMPKGNSTVAAREALNLVRRCLGLPEEESNDETAVPSDRSCEG